MIISFLNNLMAKWDRLDQDCIKPGPWKPRTPPTSDEVAQADADMDSVRAAFEWEERKPMTRRVRAGGV